MKNSISSAILLIASLFGLTKTFAQNANTSLSNLESHTKINHTLTPNATNSISLGSGSAGWVNCYLTGGLYLDGHKFLNNSGTGNNFIGTDAGKATTDGLYNTGVGFNALYSNSTGKLNTAVGYKALYNNTADNNTATGYGSLFYNTTGIDNVAGGTYSLYLNTTGQQNTANGYAALYSNTDGSYNSAYGMGALNSNISGTWNTANGAYAMYFNNSGYYNTATGGYALYNTTGGAYNTANGYAALFSNSTGTQNTATGWSALYHNNTGIENTADGLNALSSNTTGNSNTGIGWGALDHTTISDGNTAVGSNTGSTYDNGFFNVFVGANTDVTGPGFYNVIGIGQGTVCTDVSQVTIGNSATATYRAYANWTNISDGRFKKNIKENVPGLAFINELQPITYTLDATGIENFLHKDQPQDKQLSVQAKTAMSKALAAKEKTFYTGFIAQDVEKAAKSLNYDFSGVDAAKNDKDLYGLRYAEFVVPLVKAVQQLSKMNNDKDSVMQLQNAKIGDLQNQINDLKTMVLSLSGSSSPAASLSQNTPNPFRGSTSIHYNLPQTYSSAKIVVTDYKGAALKVYNLNAAGSGNVQVDAATLASGAYSYTLYVNEKKIDSKQMISAK